VKFLAIPLISLALIACGGGTEPFASPPIGAIKAAAPSPVKKATTITGGNAVVIHLYQALYGMAPSNALLVDYAFQSDTDAPTFAKNLSDRFAATSHADLAKLVLDNLGVTPTTVPAINAKGDSEYALLLDAVKQIFAVYPTMRGQVILNMTNLLAGLEGDATYGGAAAVYNVQSSANFTYSANPANVVSACVSPQIHNSAGDSCVTPPPVTIASQMSQYWAIEDTGLLIPNDNLNSDRWFNHFASTDINNDGIQDIVLTATVVAHGVLGVKTNNDFFSNPPKIILGGQKILSGESAFQGSIPTGTGFGRIVMYDINGDGRDDILFQNSGPDGAASPGGQSQLAMSSSKDYEFVNLPEALAFTHSSAAGKISGNKVIFFNTLQSSGVNVPFLLIYRNGSFVMDRSMLPSFITDTTTDPWAPTISRAVRGFTASAIGDIDDDGTDDLILGQWGPNLLSSGTDPASSIFFGTATGWASGRTVKLPNPRELPPEKVTVLDIQLADLFKSGKKDIIIVYTDNYNSRGLQILRNNGGGNFTDISAEALGAGSYNLGRAEFQSKIIDINGDGCMDIVLPYYKERGDGKAFGEVFLSDCNGKFVDATQGFNSIILELQSKLKKGLIVAGGIFLMPLKDYTGRTSFYILVEDDYNEIGQNSTHIMKLKNVQNMPTPSNGEMAF
jgi:hypothetical protein